MKLTEIKKVTKRVGLIPFYFDEDGQLKMFFMIPSDPDYGGDKPQIAKGAIEEGMNEQENAVREGEEELGLRQGNIAMIFRVYNGKPFPVYAAAISDPNDFGQFHYETKATHWLTPEEFEAQGRQFQKFMVRSIARSLYSRQGKEEI